MAELKRIVNYLNKELAVKKIRDDYSINGLQIKGKSDVKKIVVGVDACLELFEKAAKRNADMILVHHGLLRGKDWLKTNKTDELLNKRISMLKKNKMSLYGCHLPLDAHARLGNNIQLTNLFRFKKIIPFAKYYNTNIGFYGDLVKSMSINQFISYVRRELGEPRILLFGNKVVKRLGIVSGEGTDAIKEMNKLGIDTILLGEHKHSTYHIVKERRVNVISAGHYITETFGVKAVAKELEKRFDVETEFIDIPTGL